MHTYPRFNESLLLRAQHVKVLFLDVDGVLTDGSLFISSEGETFKRFHTLDGHGLKMLQAGGVEPVVITGRDSLALKKRLNELGLHTAFYGAVREACDLLLHATGAYERLLKTVAP